MPTQRFFANAPRHMEPLLAEELRALGVANVGETRGGVHFEDTLAAAYRVCLWSRIANRVLLELARFPAETPEALYAGVQAIDWSAHFDVTQTFAVSAITARSQIDHSQFAALKAKDAVVDQFRERMGERPSVDTFRPQIGISVYLYRDQATVGLDLAGESLHRRGYREEGASAPLKENLAAAILLRAGWPAIAANGGTLIDPMCGSGTLPIEAALMAADIAPGLTRPHWGFTAWKQHDATAWADLVEEAQRRREAGIEQLPPIRGYDRDPRALEAARHNLERAGLTDHIAFARAELADCAPLPTDRPGLFVVNPPYGERLGEDSELPGLYAEIGRVLRERFGGWQAAVFTGNPNLAGHLGIRFRKTNTFFNGPIECRLFSYEVSEANVTRRLPRALPPEERSESAQGFANRLEKNAKHLARWLKREDIHCYRLYDADIPEYALAIDVYEGAKRWVHAQEYQAPRTVDEQKARVRLREAIGIILEVLAIPEEQLFLKLRQRQKGRAQYEKLAENRHFHEVQEGPCRLLVNFEDYLDTGLFLDHRITRQRIGEMAAGKRFLNLFAYTGAATVHAAHGGAASTTTVDMSKTYLAWAERNLRLNGFSGSSHEFVQANCLEWIRHNPYRREFDLIFLDPPSFSTSKRMEGTFDVQRDHAGLITDTMKLLAQDGTLVFSNNLRRFRMDREALADFVIEDITRATIPRDFERNPKIHNCWTIRWQG
ncbi:MAG TPA: bifunctional 23S rRNA (guanine(2069)-N(7))-methyltransferase RlmK/23S rRNA (guanine(2445)-N(2))-methyltransferase RlmL [Thioalkalivibrio sp.]|nr:bifunctional 23S rRNA (guanine(2069)-N(7))-methyltransferase RlmK/23S rRNA (guanine(2445)-N(2))-methyltransferase RlmL [Thioalkalivibrio sp.]